MIGYIKLNIITLFKNHLGVFLLIIVSEILTALCILFSYGLVMNAQDEHKELDDLMFYYEYELSGVDRMQDRIKELKSVLGDEIAYYDPMVEVTDENGSIYRIWVIPDSPTVTRDCSGVYIYSAYKYLVKDGKIKLNGKDFKVNEIIDDRFVIDSIEIPEVLLTDDMRGVYIHIGIKSKPTSETVNWINSTVKRIFGAEPEYSPQPLDLMKKQLNNTFYAYAFVIVMIAVMNLAMYFRYIVGLRKKQIRIFTACGATSEDINRIFLFENLLELVTGYAAAFLIFRFGLFKVLLKFYPAFEDYYSAKVYLITLAIFVVGSLLILMLLISPSIRKAADAGERSV